MSGKLGLVFVIVAFILGAVFGCLVLGQSIPKVKASNFSGEACFFCKQEKAEGHTKTDVFSKAPASQALAESGAQVVAFDYKVTEGAEAHLTLLTRPGSICTIRYLNPRNSEEQVAGQPFQKAGVDGLCAWSWKIKPGSIITDNNLGTVIYWAGGQSGYLYFNILPQVGYQP